MIRPADSESIDSPSKVPTEKSTINSEPAKKPGRGRGRPRKKPNLPTRHRGKLIKTEADLNTSEDTDRQKDIEVGNAALERLKKKKRDEEEAIFESIRATYNLRSAGDSGEKSLNKAVSNKEENINPVPDKTEKEKPKKNPNKRKGQTQEPEETKPKKPKNKAKNKEEQDGNLDDQMDRNEASNDEDKEEKIDRNNKQKNKNGKVPSKGSRSKANDKKDTPETGNGKSLRSRTIKSAQPSTSVNDDEEETLEAEEFTCKICSKTFKNYNEIKAHKLLCTKLKKKYACSVCSKGFTQKSMLEDHFDYLHTNKPRKYRCKPCNKTFEQKKVYLEHNRRLHSKSDYKFVCDECGRGFFVKGEFTCHRLSHTGVKPFACGVCTVARFATPGRLNAHLAKCGKPLAFQCDLCGKHFSSQQAVNVHIAEAHATPGKNKTWECPLCEDVHYSSQGGWYKHLRNQHGITRYGKKLEEAIIEEAQKNAENETDESSKSDSKEDSESED